jgi:hypothetical protein
MTEEYWRERVQTAEFASMAAGKEIGHRIADYVDDHTTAKLFADLDVKHEVNAKGGTLTKLLKRLMDHQIDSYDLLIVKMNLPGVDIEPHATAGETIALDIEVHVYFVDMLDYLDFVTFDAGPGQLMLKEREFYPAVDALVEQPTNSLAEKVERCMALMEDGIERLLRNRETRVAELRDQMTAFRAVANLAVDQAGLLLG